MDNIKIVRGYFENNHCDISIVVIFAKYKNLWVISQEESRDTWEVQGGMRELNEDVRYAAARELYEECGARIFKLAPITDYSLVVDGDVSRGQLFYCEISEMGELPTGFEIAKVKFVDTFPENMTYPEIHKHLFELLKKQRIDDNTLWYNYEIRNDELLEKDSSKPSP